MKITKESPLVLIAQEYQKILAEKGEVFADDFLDELSPGDYPFYDKVTKFKMPAGVTVTPQIEGIKSKKIKLQGLKTLPEKKHVIKRLGISRGNLCLLVAVGGSGKTMLCQYLTSCISSGTPLFGQFPVQKGPCIHIDQEQSEVQTLRRYIRIAGGLRLDSIDVDRVTLDHRMDDPSHISLDQMEDRLVKLFEGSNFVIIDSLKKCSVADENSDRIEPVLKMLKTVAERSQTAILLIHHKGKGKIDAKQTGRGHSSIYDSVDVQIDLDCADDGFELSCAKNRDGRTFSGIKYQLLDTGEWIPEQDCSEFIEFSMIADEIEKPSKQDEIKDKIMNLLKAASRPVSKQEIYDSVRGDRNKVLKAVNEMADAGEILSTDAERGRKVYSVKNI